jgi:hypothetical protein
MALRGLHYKNTDNTKWGTGDGSGTAGRLASLQADLNIWMLDERVHAIEVDPPTAVSIIGFTVIGSQMQVNMSDGSHLGPYNLPIATFRLLGEWVNSYPYEELNFFTAPGFGLYYVKITHTSPASPAEFDPTAIDEDSASPTFGNPLYQLVFGSESAIYDIGWFYPGTPGRGIASDEAMFAHVLSRPVLLPAGLPGAKAKLMVQAATALQMDIMHNTTVVGSLDFAIGDVEGVFTFASDVTLAIDDLIWLPPPAPDATAKGLNVTIPATRQDI